MDLDPTCDDFQFANTSSSVGNDIDYQCDKLLKESKTTALKSPSQNAVAKCAPSLDMSRASSSSSFMSTNGMGSQHFCATNEALTRAPNIEYELSVAKSILQQYSSISGDNLFDHLSDIIKRVIDERPPNVIDFFEEFSRNVREQKFHLPERFPPAVAFQEKRLYKLAKQQLISMKLPYATDFTIQAEDELEEERSKHDDLHVDSKMLKIFDTINDRVQHLQFFWNQCGFSISAEDIFQLACSMDRLQTHPSIIQCRFWGMINGLKASYYIVEGTLSHNEYEARLLQMEKELKDNFRNQSTEDAKSKKPPSHVGNELTPGAVGWENHPAEDILKMKPHVLPVPLVKNVEVFDIPPEPIGKGVNRYSYFVVNSLFDEWTELPITTPKQISLSRRIKKFFTGDLEEDIVSYPCFGGKEKHYLRAMIARITAGTYIAPKNYYRKMTKKERRLFEEAAYDGADDDVEEDDEEDTQVDEDEESEAGEADNDVVLVKNEKYDSSISLKILISPAEWVHVRPNILLQGRVVWYNQELAMRQIEKQRKLVEAEIEQNESDDGEEEDEEDEEEELEVEAEKGPVILTSCSLDMCSEIPVPWTGRFTSRYTNKNERLILMQSNVWPGACTFVYRDLCESIYLGWGHKVVSRNITWQHLTPIAEEYKHDADDFMEMLDPSVEMEDAYKLSLLEKDLKRVQMPGDTEAQGSTEEEEDDNDENENENEED